MQGQIKSMLMWVWFYYEKETYHYLECVGSMSNCMEIATVSAVM